MKPEILAPAQDPEHVLTAVEAGADAVYLGLKELSARQRGVNFTIPQLAEAIAWCHERDARVYVALNTVVKEHELPTLAEYLGAVVAHGADGLIVQDLGLASLAHDLFPELLLHASTQLTVHNAEGVREAARIGFQRVILARELSAREITAISRESPIELEVFVHGSYCFSFSGLCLASSFLGGYSGNRGWCTQACRRPYWERDRPRYTFSMADLSIARNAGLLRSLPVAAWKIEGRLKYPDYVERTVTAYRLLRDGTSDQVKELLTSVKTRPMTTGFLQEKRDLTCPDLPGFTGTFVGSLGPITGNLAQVRLKAAIGVGHKLRLQSKRTEEGKSFRLSYLEAGGRSIGQAQAKKTVRIKVPEKAERGDLLFLLARGEKRNVSLRAAVKPWQRRATMLRRKAADILTAKHDLPPPRRGRELTLETDDLALARSAPRAFGRIILRLSDRLMHELKPGILRKVAGAADLGISIPPVTLPERTQRVRQALAQLADWGIGLFEINNIGAWDLLPENVRVQAGPFLYAHNTHAAATILTRGAERIVFPLEGDYETLDALCNRNLAPYLEIVLYGYVPLFMSRVRIEGKGTRELTDRLEERFLLMYRDGMTYLYGRRPTCLFSYRKKMTKRGLRHFRMAIPARFFAARDLPRLVSLYQRGKDADGSTPFNFERGLK